MRKRTDPLTRFMRMVTVQEDGCWYWSGYLDPQGYGSFRLSPETNANKAHRVGYQLLREPVPPSLTLDHLCGVRKCVNPDHLEPVTPQANTDRGLNAKRATCRAAGHPMTPDNTGNRASGQRYCMACHRAREQNRRDRQRAAFRNDPKAGVCGKGHPMWGRNLGERSNGRRYCKTCSRLRASPPAERRRAATKAHSQRSAPSQ